MQPRERSPSENLFWPTVIATGMHVLIFGMLFVSFASTPELPPSRPVVQATLYQLRSESQATTQTNQKIAGEAKKTAAQQFEIEQMEQKKREQERQAAAAKAAEQKKAEEARKAEAAKAAEAQKQQQVAKAQEAQKQKEQEAAKAKADAEAKAAEQKRQAEIARKKAVEEEAKKKAAEAEAAKKKAAEEAAKKQAAEEAAKKRAAEEAAKKKAAEEAARKKAAEDEAKKKAAAEAARKAQEDKKAQALAELLAEDVQRQQAMADTHGSNVAGNLDDLIINLVSQQWRRPPSARNGMSVEVAIQMLPDGTITNATVTRSSGDAPFDSSAVAAVRNVGRIPEMQQLDRATFDRNYRQRRIIFKPEDLGL